MLGSTSVLVAIVGLWLISALAPPWPSEAKAAYIGPAGSALKSFLRDFGEGFVEARRHPWFLSGLAALTLVIALGYSVTGVMVPAISQSVYGNSLLLVGTSTAYTLGALLGAILLSRWKPRARGWWALSGLAAYSLVPLGLLFPQQLFIPFAAFFAAGVGIEVFNIFWFSALQEEVAPDRLARVSSLDFLLSYGLAPMGLVIVAPLSKLIGVESMLILTAALCTAAPASAAVIRSCQTFRQTVSSRRQVDDPRQAT